MWTDVHGGQQSEIDQTEQIKFQGRAEKQALLEIKALHAAARKYTYDDESQESILTRCGVQTINLYGTYLRGLTDRKVQLLDGKERQSQWKNMKPIFTSRLIPINFEAGLSCPLLEFSCHF